MIVKQIYFYFKQIITLITLKVEFWGKLSFGLHTHISPTSTFEGANKIYSHSIFNGSLGYGSYIQENCAISAHVGRFTSIGPSVKTNRGVHPIEEPYVTTCPMFFSTRKQNGNTFANRILFDELRKPPVIGSDCWIGERAFIIGNVNIGDGAVVLAGAVVTKDIPPYAIVGGVPAKIIKYRYDSETIKMLEDFKWWNKDIDWLKEHWEYFNNMEKFKQLIKE